MKPITELPLMGGRPMTPEEEVRFWRYFYAESQRLFGGKGGNDATLESLTAKAMNLLKYDAEFVARYGVPGYEFGPNAKKSAEMRKRFDDGKLKDWGKRNVPIYLKLAYEIYTSPTGGMSKEDAIRQIAKDYGFDNFEAAYKALYRLGIKGLPSTWPK